MDAAKLRFEQDALQIGNPYDSLASQLSIYQPDDVSEDFSAFFDIVCQTWDRPKLLQHPMGCRDVDENVSAQESTTLMPPGEDGISEPPDYPLDGIFKSPPWSHSDGDRLEAWARCDPIDDNPNNLLRSNNSYQTPVEVPSGLSSAANAASNDSIEAEASSEPLRTKSQKTVGKGSGVGG